MAEIFLKLANMSITASWLILAVLVLRWVLKKVPKAFHCMLWGLVGIRLLCPISIESVFSLIPSAEVIPSDILYTNKPGIESGIDRVNQVVNPILTESLAPNLGDSVNPLQVVTAVASFIWVLGMVGLLLYILGTYIRLKWQVREAVRLEGDIFRSERATSPFVLGVIKPRIYIPYGLQGEELSCVIAHERAHIKRKDHWIKPGGFLLLTVYWFNPLVWVAYNLLCRDIEFACDERVMREIGMDKKKLYSKALLNCSVSHRKIAACPLAFGEVGVKQRIQNVLSYKKPTFWLLLVAVLACVVCMVCFMTVPREQTEDVSKQAESGLDVSFEGEENESRSETLPTELAILQSPPTMLLQDSLSSRLDYFAVDAGTYSWQYKDGEMMTGVEAGGNVPQIAVKGQEWLQLVSYNKLDYVPYTLHFSMEPDRITVREYDLLQLADIDAEVISETVYEENFVSIPLQARRIYEVIAEWNESNLESNGCYGTAYYAFATDNDIVYEERQEEVTIEAHVKEILADWENTILISSDTDSFPGAFIVKVSPEVYEVGELSGGDALTVMMWDTGEIVNQIPVYEASYVESHEAESTLLLGDEFTEEVNQFDGVTMIMEKYKATEGEVEFFNGTEKEVTYGDYFDIQAESDGEWYSLQVPDDIAYHAVAYPIAPGQTSIWQINWEWIYGSLPTGHYRIVKDVMDYRAPGDYTKYYMAAEFEMMESH